MTPAERAERGRQADELLASALLRDCLKAVEMRCFEAFKGATTDEERRNAQALSRTCGILWDSLRRVAGDGKLALEEIRKARLKEAA